MNQPSPAGSLLVLLGTALSLVFLQVVQNLLLLLYLAAVVLTFLVRDLDLELVVVEFLLLPFDLDAQL